MSNQSQIYGEDWILRVNNWSKKLTEKILVDLECACLFACLFKFQPSLIMEEFPTLLTIPMLI